MKRFRDLSIKYKFLVIVLFTSGVSLLFTSTAVILYDTKSSKEAMVAELAAHADIVAHNIAAALTFDDRESADETLRALRVTGSVMTAYVLEPGGAVFGRYVRDDTTLISSKPLLDREGYHFFDDRLAMRRPVILQGELLGAVYIEGDLTGLHERIRRYLGMAIGVVACAMIIVLLLSSRLQRVFTAPILNLADTAKTISRRKNYGLRAEKSANDEVGVLIDCFNEMVAQVQDRDGTLEKHRDELEREVTLRTGELRTVNARLKESEARIRAIVEGTSATIGVEFFDALAVTLARALGVRWVMVASLLPGERAETKALWDGTRIVRDMVYDLSGTPCERAVADSFAVYEDGVTELFPEDEKLREWKVRSYVGVVLRDSNGAAIGVLNAFHDEPMAELARHGSLLRVFASRAAAELERMIVEEELFRSESRTRAILDSAADGIITISDHGVIETFNSAAEQIFGYLGDQVRGIKVAQLMRFAEQSERNDAFRAHPESVLAAFIGQRGEIEGVRHDGTSFPMNIVVSRLEAGGEASYTAIVRDITREREVEQMKSDFVSTVSHEIRTPLSCIISAAKILQKQDGTEPGVINKFSAIIGEEGKRLSRLINDLLDLSKMDAGGLEWTFQEADASELIDQVVSLNRAEARRHDIEFQVDVPDRIPGLKVDRDRFVQVLNNLISNAIKFSQSGGAVDIVARRHDADFVRISVVDRGIGIAPEHQGLIFDRFKQIGDVLTDRPQGTGLGLPICKEIVEFLGGRVWVESEPGKGSTFSFTVPAAGHVGEEEDSESSSPKVATVLVVDDERATRELIAYLLHQNGYSVIEAAGGEEALRLAAKHHPDLITLDVLMPDRSGYEVVAALRENEEIKEIPVLLLSVLGDPANAEQGLRLGANAYLTKPVDEELLIATTRRLLGANGRKVLVIDGDFTSNSKMKADLVMQGYSVVQAFDTRSGLDFAERLLPDLIIFGPPCADVDRNRLVKLLRARIATEAIPVLIVSDFELHGVNAAFLDTTGRGERSARGSVEDILASFIGGLPDAGDDTPSGPSAADRSHDGHADRKAG